MKLECFTFIGSQIDAQSENKIKTFEETSQRKNKTKETAAHTPWIMKLRTDHTHNICPIFG